MALAQKAERLKNRGKSYESQLDGESALKISDINRAAISFENAGTTAAYAKRALRAKRMFLKASNLYGDEANRLVTKYDSEDTSYFPIKRLKDTARAFLSAGITAERFGLGRKRHAKKMYEKAAQYFVSASKQAKPLSPLHANDLLNLAVGAARASGHTDLHDSIVEALNESRRDLESV